MIQNKFIILLFFVALASGFFWNQKMFGQPISGDQNSYNNVAQNILRGEGFTRDGRDMGMEPFYPLFLSGIYKIFGHNYDAVRIIQIILFAITVVLVYLIAKMLFNERIAFISALAIALFYGLANQAGNITTEALFTFLLVFFMYAITKYFHNYNYGNIWWLAVSGIVLGLATLTKGIIQFLPLVVILNIFAIYFKKIPIKKILVKAAVFLILFLAVLFPWFMRGGANVSSAVAPRGGAILTARAELMENLYSDYFSHFMGHFFGYYFAQKINPSVNSAVFRDDAGVLERYNELVEEGKNEVEIDGILFTEAKNKILAAPHKYVLMSLLDFISFNSPIIPSGSLWQNTLTIHPMFAEGRHSDIPELVKTAIILGLRFIWFAFVFLVTYGIIKSVGDWAVSGWLVLIVIYFNLAYSAIHAIPRYALPVYPFYVILAVVGTFYFYDKYTKKQK